MTFFVQEMRAKRPLEREGKAERFFNWLYEVTSFYGSSIRRPCIGLLLIFSISLGLSSAIPTLDCQNKWPYLVHVTLTNMILLPAGYKSGQTVISKCLYGEEGIPSTIFFLATIEGFLGTVFLFLLLLGIRNKFKIK